MAGEIDLTTAVEVARYGESMKEIGKDQFHFYADNANLSNAVLSAISHI